MMRLETPTPPLETPERSLVRLPRHPGAGAREVRCDGQGGKCRKLLGITDGRYLFVNNDGREIVSALPATVRCERCRTVATVG
jgi:hypothetical protein